MYTTTLEIHLILQTANEILREFTSVDKGRDTTEEVVRLAKVIGENAGRLEQSMISLEWREMQQVIL